jgi:hypothetical protein
MKYSFRKSPPRWLNGTAGRIHMRRGVHGGANHAPVSWSMDFNLTCAGPSWTELLRRAGSVCNFVNSAVSTSYQFMEQNFLIPFAKLKRQKLENCVTFRSKYYTVKVYGKYGGNSRCCGH